MKVIIKSDYDSMSRAAAQILLGTMYQDKRVNLSLSAGKSPVRTYEIITPLLKADASDFSNVHYYNFDNFKMPGREEGFGMYELREQFLDPAGVTRENIHILHDDNWQDYDAEIENAGGLDLMFIGMGADGHFCANLPGSTDFTKGTHTVPFKPGFPWYAPYKAMLGDDAPESMVTIGPAAVMKVKRVVLIVNGAAKAGAVRTLMESRVEEMFPSSILKLHPNFTVILDAEAASLI